MKSKNRKDPYDTVSVSENLLLLLDIVYIIPFIGLTVNLLVNIFSENTDIKYHATVRRRISLAISIILLVLIIIFIILRPYFIETVNNIVPSPQIL